MNTGTNIMLQQVHLNFSLLYALSLLSHFLFLKRNDNNSLLSYLIIFTSTQHDSFTFNQRCLGVLEHLLVPQDVCDRPYAYTLKNRWGIILWGGIQAQDRHFLKQVPSHHAT